MLYYKRGNAIIGVAITRCFAAARLLFFATFGASRRPNWNLRPRLRLLRRPRLLLLRLLRVLLLAATAICYVVTRLLTLLLH